MDREGFWSRVDKSTDCWIWTGAKIPTGYGVAVVDGARSPVHRFAYTELVGPIPEGLVIDHLCRVRNCVNPAHLEPVTHRENILRGVGYTAVAAAKTHCKNGHEYTPENTRKATNGRWCRTCHNEWKRKDRARKKAEKASEEA